MRSQTETTPTHLDDAKQEVRKLIDELKAIGKRLEPIRDAIPLPPEPMKTLMEAGYIPRDEAVLLWDDLDFAARNPEDSDALGPAIDWLEFALSWSSRRRRERLFAENHDLDRDAALPALSLEEGRMLVKMNGDVPGAAWRLGLTLGRMDPDEDIDAFLDTLSAIARLKARKIEALQARRLPSIHADSVKYDADSLENVLAALEDQRETPQYAQMKVTLGVLQRLQGIS